MSLGRTGALRNRNFLLLWVGNGTSLMGIFGARICYPILALDISGSAVLAGWTTFAATVPNLLFLPHAGVFADYSDRRRTMLSFQLLGAAMSAVLTVWVVINGPSLSAVLVVVALIEGTAFAYFSLAEVAAIRDLVPKDQYLAAFSLYEAEKPVAILMGRVFGAGLLGVARWAPFAGNLASYAVSIGSVSAMRGDFSPVASESASRRESFWSRTREGISWVRRSRFLGTSTIATAVANVLFQITILLLIVRSHQEGRPAWVVGFVLSSAGVGGVIGAALAPRLTKAFAPGPVFVAGLWAWALALTPMALTSYPIVMAVCWFAVGAVGTVVAVVNTLNRIEAAPPEAVGRVVGLASLITDGAVPVGAALGGYVLATWGTQTTAWLLPIALVVLALSGGAALRSPDAASSAETKSASSVPVESLN